MKPLVDVVIPVFNAARTVRSAIESIQHQTVRNIGIIVVDDGSTDDTPNILREIAAGDERVWILRQKNRGISDARNAGLAECRAELVAWLDADDLSAPDRLERQSEYLQANPDCAAVSGGVRYIDEAGRFQGLISPRIPPETADALWIPAKEPYLLQPFLMVRRTIMETLGGYRHLIYSEDSDLCWRMQEMGRLHVMEDLLGDYRLHTSSVSSRSIVNGRIMAMSSQLVAISAMRRRSGQPDLSFTREKAARFRSVEKLSDMFAVGCEDLSGEEIDHLEIAASAKLIELASCRPYELDIDDCRFIHSAVRKHVQRVSRANRSALFRSCAGTAARLLQQGLFREAGALLSPRLYPMAAARWALRTLASPAHIVRLRESLGRAPNVLIK